MTHTSTEQERAEFEKYMLLENYFSERDLVWDGADGYDCTDADDAFGIWLIARRAQVVAVPQGLREAAQRAHDWMERQQRQQSKGGHATFDMMMLREERDALAEALAVAPQPPEER